MRTHKFKSLLMPSWVGGNQLELHVGGDAYFDNLIVAINNATTTIFIETYIFCPHGKVLDVITALLDAAVRGVKVVVVVDGYGSQAFISDLSTRLAHPNIELQVFRLEKKAFRFSRQYLRRLHRKLVLIDGKYAWVGGINFLDDWYDPNHGQLDEPRLDYALKIVGPVCEKILLSMQRQHLQLGWLNQTARRQWNLIKKNWVNKGPQNSSTEPVYVQFLLRDNLHFRRNIEKAYLEAVKNATKEIWIANAYFFPGERLRLALVNAAKRGVSVNLLLQGKVEYRFAYYAGQALYEDLVRANIHIYEYQASFLHAKIAVIDGEWLTVGSSNLDPFSLFLAREANVVVKDVKLAGALLEHLKQTLAQAVLIDRHTLKERSWLKRLFFKAMLKLSRLGMAFSASLGKNIYKG